MNPQIASLVRFALAALGTFLVAEGYLNAAGEPQFVDYAVGAVGSVISLVSLFWGVRDKSETARTINAALSLPSMSSPEELRQVTRGGLSGGWSDILARQAIRTVISTLRDQPALSLKIEPHLLRLRDELNEAFPPDRVY